jgi:histidine ammonia-lyase
VAAEPALQLTGRDLTVPDVVSVARGGRAVEVEAAARQRMATSREVIERLVAAGETVYGVTTGFGDLADVRISPEQ